MNEENLKQLVADGLLALKASGRITAAGTDETADVATDPELRSVLETGNETAKEWTARIDRAMNETGASGEGENPILEVHVRVAKQIRDAAPDEQVRDEGPWNRLWIDQRLRLVPLGLRRYGAAFPGAAEFAPSPGGREEEELRVAHTTHTPGSYCSAGSVEEPKREPSSTEAPS